MVDIISTSRFRKSLKRLRRSGNFDDSELEMVMDHLAVGDTLPGKYRDHHLSGDLGAFRELHLEFDLLLLYIKKRCSNFQILLNCFQLS